MSTTQRDGHQALRLLLLLLLLLLSRRCDAAQEAAQRCGGFVTVVEFDVMGPRLVSSSLTLLSNYC